jgi:hypothetical protein
LVRGTPYTSPTGQIVDVPGLIAYQRSKDEGEQAVLDWDLRDSQRNTTPKTQPTKTPYGFNTEEYLDANPDVRAAGLDAAQHYITYGWAEGRKLRTDQAQAAWVASKPVSTTSSVPFQWQNQDANKTGIGATQNFQTAAESFSNEWRNQDQVHNFERQTSNQAKAGSYDQGIAGIYDQWRQSGIKGGLARQAQINASQAWGTDVAGRAQAEGQYQTGTHEQRTEDLLTEGINTSSTDQINWGNSALPTYNIHDPIMVQNAMNGIT